MTTDGRIRLGSRTQAFTESVIREMTRLNLDLNGPDRAINFAQGYPDFPPPEEIVAAAHQALDGDPSIHQYSTTWGTARLRQAIAETKSRQWGRPVDPEQMVTVTCGATEAMIAAMLAIVEPGDEVIIFEPHYENYGPDCVISGATPRHVHLLEPDWTFDPEEVERAFTSRTRAVVINTPHNPTGKVFSPAELDFLARLCQRHDAIAITDEIYERLVYEGEHVSMATLPGMEERTITISGASKTFSVTGWRVGWVVAPPALTDGVRKVHDFLTVGAAHPLQMAVAAALELPPSFHSELVESFRKRRDLLVGGLAELGFAVLPPAGAYYVMAGISNVTRQNADRFARDLIQGCAVATVPATSFYSAPGSGQETLRFSFPKRLETIARGLDSLRAYLTAGSA